MLLSGFYLNENLGYTHVQAYFKSSSLFTVFAGFKIFNRSNIWSDAMKTGSMPHCLVAACSINVAYSDRAQRSEPESCLPGQMQWKYDSGMYPGSEKLL